MTSAQTSRACRNAPAVPGKSLSINLVPSDTAEAKNYSLSSLQVYPGTIDFGGDRDRFLEEHCHRMLFAWVSSSMFVDRCYNRSYLLDKRVDG